MARSKSDKEKFSNIKHQFSNRKPDARGQKTDLRQVKSYPPTSNEPKSAMKNRKSNGCFCYIVECVDGTFYTGWTTNLERRVATHNAGRGSRYTRPRRPVKLVYFESLLNRAEAMRREIQIKHMSRSAKQKHISNFKSQTSNDATDA
jgi:putative endonuclease